MIVYIDQHDSSLRKFQKKNLNPSYFVDIDNESKSSHVVCLSVERTIAITHLNSDADCFIQFLTCIKIKFALMCS